MSLFYNVAALSLQLYQRESPTQCFPVNIAKFLKVPILENICGRLLLDLSIYAFIHLSHY